MKIVVLEPIGISQERIQKIAAKTFIKDVDLVSYETKTEDINELIKRANDADVIILANMPLKIEVLEKCPKVKLISVAFTGVDHIPMDYCKKHDIMVCNCAGYSTTAVSELVFGMAISLIRNIIPCDIAIRDSGTRAGLVGCELKGKKFGVIGTGAIGIETARIANAFGCTVYAYSRTQKDISYITYTELDTVMRECDIISLHIPLNEYTKGLISAKKIAMLKRNAILINVARGAVVDNEALAQALNNGAIAGAGIDVFENEPPIEKSHSLLNCPNTIVTPHVAFATKESLLERAEMVFENIKQWCNGTPKNVM